MKEDAPQRQDLLRELFNALRYIVRCGCQWRMMLHDFPPWQVVYQQARRWSFVLLPKRWVVVRTFGWAARFKRLARDYEHLASTLAGMRWVAFTTLILSSLFPQGQ